MLTLIALMTAMIEPPPPAAPLLTWNDVVARCDDPNFRLLDARARADYDAGHVPGAVWVDAKGLEKLAGQPGALADASRWVELITPLGIGTKTKVHVYDANKQLDAVRTWFLLRYLGVQHVGLIDGSFSVYAKAGHPLATTPTKVDPIPFTPQINASLLATRDDMHGHLKSKDVAILDARSVAEHDGSVKKSQRGGHIPTACNLEWTNLVDADGHFLDLAAVKAKLAKAGLPVVEGKRVVTHCQGGGRASVAAFALERAGFPTRNYYLGWSEWGNAEDTPITVGSSPK